MVAATVMNTQELWNMYDAKSKEKKYPFNLDRKFKEYPEDMKNGIREYYTYEALKYI